MTQISLDWKAKSRWFASEFIIVVAGVLTAMLVASWGGKRQDSAREQAYLGQLGSDLFTTDSLIRGIDSLMLPIDKAGTSFVRAFLMADQPLGDSLATWLDRGHYWEDPRPVIGTAESLIASGDIRLISSDSLRSHIISYVERTRQLVAQQQFFIGLWTEGYEEVGRAIDNSEIVGAARTAEYIDSVGRLNPRYPIPSGMRRHPFPVNWERVLRDQSVYEAARKMNSAKMNLSDIRQDMRTATEGLRVAVRKSQQKS